nr:unnamed protein product [Spirometra erinaceieuropaei]
MMLCTISTPARPAPQRFQAAKAEFENMLQLGIIRPSESPSASPLHMVPRAILGDWRPCGDYRALTNATIPDRYPVPHLQDFAGALFGNAVFSKIDLFSRLPFGLRNAAQTFQRFIDHVFRGLPFVYAYIDDLLVASRNEEEHKDRFALVFDRLDKFGAVINPSKCVLGCARIRTTAYHLAANGVVERFHCQLKASLLVAADPEN